MLWIFWLVGMGLGSSPEGVEKQAETRPAVTAIPKTGPVGVDLNQATLAELIALPGIGPKRAQEILHRRSIRPFRRVAEILRIRGIGRKTYKKLKPFLRVGPKPTPTGAAARSSKP